MNKFEQVNSLVHQMSVAGAGSLYAGEGTGVLYRGTNMVEQTNMTEKITFPQILWRAVKLAEFT